MSPDREMTLREQVAEIGTARGYQGQPMSHAAIVVAERILVHIAAFGLSSDTQKAINDLMLKFSADDEARERELAQSRREALERQRVGDLVEARKVLMADRMSTLYESLKPIPSTTHSRCYHGDETAQEAGTVQVNGPYRARPRTCVFCTNAPKWAIAIGKNGVVGVCGLHGRDELIAVSLASLIDDGTVAPGTHYTGKRGGFANWAASHPTVERLLALLKAVAS